MKEPAQTPSQQDDNVAISADGVPIHFSVQGQGSPGLVFVHGGGGNGKAWEDQVPFFARRHKVVAVSLAGYGNSGHNRTAWTMEAFGEDVVAVVDQLGLDEVVLIGWSLGGDVILEASKRLPDRVIGLVGVECLVARNFTQEEVEEFVGPFRTDFEEALDNLVRGYTSDPAMVERMHSMGPMPSAEVFTTIAEECYRYDRVHAFQEVEAPIRCIFSEGTPVDIAAGKRYASSYEVRFMSGVGHLLAWEDPQTFNRLLEEIVAGFVQLAR